MFTNYKTEAIILQARTRGEADTVFTLYTRDFGRIDVVGKSIRKATSKLKMNMSLFSCVEVSFVQGRGCNILTDASVIYNFKEAKKTLGKLSLLYKIAEVVLLLIRGQEKDEDVFLFILESFQKINKTKIAGKKLKLFFCFFSFRLLYFLGHKLYIKRCAICGESIEKEGYFNSKEGGLVCKKCFLREPTGIYLEDVASLQCFFDNNIDDVFKQDARFFMNILERYLDFVPEAQEKSFI